MCSRKAFSFMSEILSRGDAEARRKTAFLRASASPRERISDMNEKAFREHILNLLNSGDAHQDFDSEVGNMPPEIRGKRPAGADHSPWELLEHMRIAQSDILRYSRGDADYVAAEFPQGYWPATPEPPSDSAWDESVAKFRA